MSKIIRWGILGAGKIAKKFANDLQFVSNAKLVAVGSRTQENANAFAALFSIEKSYGSYEALVKDSEIDIIYIATPHVFHFENTIMCLQNGKAVLCEKPFAINEKQVLQMLQLATEKNLFLMEALWSSFLPHFIKLKEILAEGIIGEVTAMQANFGFQTNAESSKRLTERELGGGTLLDIGIYNIFFALNILGEPQSVEASMIANQTGADEQCAITYHYANGATAQLFSTFKSNIPIDAQIFGTKGNIKLTHRFYEPSCTILVSTDGGQNYITIPTQKPQGFGYEFEAQHATDCLLAGKTQSDNMSFNKSQQLIHALDTIRAKIGLLYPGDESY